MRPAELDRIRDGAVEIAAEAGALLCSGFRGASSEGVRDKGGGDLVTELDERSEALLRTRLAALTPEAAFVGEEQGGDAAGGPTWFVDPIDGTNNFAHGHPWFCLSLGLWDGDEPLVGVVQAPAMGLRYAAAKGRGVTRNGKAARVSEARSLGASLLATGFPHDRARNADNNYREFAALDARSHGVRRCAAAALELALVADGAYEGFWDRGLAAWDLAGATVLISEAGGRVTDSQGAPLKLRAPWTGLSVIATNGLLHDALADALAHARSLPAISEVQ